MSDPWKFALGTKVRYRGIENRRQTYDPGPWLVVTRNATQYLECGPCIPTYTIQRGEFPHANIKTLYALETYLSPWEEIEL